MKSVVSSEIVALLVDIGNASNSECPKMVRYPLNPRPSKQKRASRHHSNWRLLNARWQQTNQVNVHCLVSSEHAHITKNNGFYLVSLLPPSVPKVPY